VLAVLALLTLNRKGPHPAAYKLPDQWTYGPILWAATGEQVAAAGHGHGSDELTVGGGASGKW
jgi:hypothetical protein